jgi:3D (Asp-Asp-Asp) domain-containing protein
VSLAAAVALWTIALNLLVTASAFAGTSAPHVPRKIVMTATAYCLRGVTASGTPVRTGTVAADTRILPMGSRVRIRGRHVRGDYVVADEGAAVKGHRIDVYMPSCEDARRFGRQRVTVERLPAKESS